MVVLFTGLLFFATNAQVPGNMDKPPVLSARANGGFVSINGTSTSQNFNLITFTFTASGTQDDGAGQDVVCVQIWDDQVVVTQRCYNIPIGATHTLTDQLYWSGPIGTSAPGVGVCLFDYPESYIQCVDPFFTEEVHSSLVFRESNNASWECLGFGEECIPGWDHTGLHLDNEIFESHPVYPSGEYWDPINSSYVTILADPGVQSQHTLGSFQHDSMTQNSTTKNAEIPIDYNLAIQMASFIETQFDKDFLFLCGELLDLECWRDTLAPQRQKSYIGNQYTCVGLIERSAEEVGYNEGQGFVPDWMESVSIPIWGDMPLLSPQLLYWSTQASLRFKAARKWVAGLLDPVDFLLVDPEGKRFGFTQATGFVNEIPDAYYGGDGYLEQFFILDPLPGDYHLILYGLGEPTQAVLVLNVEGFSGCSASFVGELAIGETKTLDTVLLCQNRARELIVALPLWTQSENIQGLVQIINLPCQN